MFKRKLDFMMQVSSIYWDITFSLIRSIGVIEAQQTSLVTYTSHAFTSTTSSSHAQSTSNGRHDAGDVITQENYGYSYIQT